MHMCYKIFYTTWVLACQKQRLGPKLEERLGQGSIQKFGTSTYLCNRWYTNLVHNLGLGLAHQKQRLVPKLAGSGRGEHPKNIWHPLLMSATVEASD